MKFWTKGVLAFAIAVAVAGNAWAQGGGASSTGTIQGRVVDAQGAVLPGVTVTATIPSALGAQTAVTSETGNDFQNRMLRSRRSPYSASKQ